MQNEAKLQGDMGTRAHPSGAAENRLYKRSQLGAGATGRAACLVLPQRPACGSSRPSRPDWLRLTQQARRSRRTARLASFGGRPMPREWPRGREAIGQNEANGTEGSFFLYSSPAGGYTGGFRKRFYVYGLEPTDHEK